MPRAFVVIALVSALLVAAAGCMPVRHGPGGPHARPLHFRATGFFRTEYARHRWWLVTPDGRPFYSSGVNHVTASPDTDRVTGRCPYCDAVGTSPAALDAWSVQTVDRLRAWGFNTLGSWSDTDRLGARMPYTKLLGMASGNDWFSDAFVQHANAVAAADVAPYRDDPNLIGWALDSELRWGVDWRSPTTLLADYLALSDGSPGRSVAEQYAGDPDGFVRALATRYFSVTTAAVRATDPNHLVIGVKNITQLTARAVLEAASPYVDVFSVDDYTLLPGLDQQIQDAWGPFVPRDHSLAAFYDVVHRPLMVMEYSFRAADSGLPNSYPPIFPTVATQAARADAYEQYVRALHAAPWIVGDHWFEYVDEPVHGRFDGEDSNFGVVSNANVPWTALVERMTAVHASAPDRVADPRPPCLAWARVPGGRGDGRADRVRCVERG